MDGARFANALVSLGCSPARDDLARRRRRAVVRRDQERRARLRGGGVLRSSAKAESFPYLRKRGGHTLSKGRLLGAQMAAYLEGGLWLDLAARANAAARRLFDGLVALPGVRAGWPTAGQRGLRHRADARDRRVARGGRRVLRLADPRRAAGARAAAAAKR